MSGKSTFLRTVGINILLSYAGSVVDAEKFVVSRINLFSCIKVSDSVVDGISYFYAEVKRLRKIIEDIKTIEGHSLVLIDEIELHLHPTLQQEILQRLQVFLALYQMAF